MTVLSYAYAWLRVFIVFGVSATIAVPLFAFVWLVVFLAVALVAIAALGWGLVSALRAVGHRLSWRSLYAAERQDVSRSVPPPRTSEPAPLESASAPGPKASGRTA